MYYVAKTYNHLPPAIVESFEDKAHAIAYANVMNAADKGTFIVLENIKF
jgi:hypothetical protein